MSVETTSDTVRIVNQHAEEARYEFRAIHIQNIDNDLLLNDHRPDSVPLRDSSLRRLLA
jgi:hypothetical protein